VKKKKTTLGFKILKGLIHLFYGNVEVVGLENLPEKNAIIVGNHSQTNGPITAEIFMPDNCYIWCSGEMMSAKEVPEYAFRDFWSHKRKWVQPFYRLLAHLIVPIAVCLFNNARTIPVYHDMRIKTTFKESLKKLQEGINLIIFPEKDEQYNHILYQFQEHFVDVAKMYHRKSGEALTFVPLYIAPRMRKAFVGKGIEFDPENTISDERERIIAYLMNEITDMAENLPKHTVVPYRNMSRRLYVSNKDKGVLPGEKTSC